MTVARETEAILPGHGVSRETPARPGPLASIVLLPIRFYRRFVSPAIGPRCRYYPTCSTYAEEAVRELGPFRGMILAAWRVLRCNPFSNGGFDTLSDRTLFRNTPTRTERAATDR
ncbi:MAG: membrane protein insertion efficiency factor YidD [Solirubrobacterales bacterium]